MMAMLGKRFEGALTYAARLHRADIRKGTKIPYVAHLLASASIVLEHGGDEDEAIAALLHDAAEDHGREQVGRIRRRFGATVAEIVDGCTDSFECPRPPWRARKERYIAALPTKPPSTRLVSAADKLHNARAILRDYRAEGEGLWTRFSAGERGGVLWYYRNLVAAFRDPTSKRFRSAAKARGLERLVDELDRVVQEIEHPAWLSRAAARGGGRRRNAAAY